MLRTVVSVTVAGIFAAGCSLGGASTGATAAPTAEPTVAPTPTATETPTEVPTPDPSPTAEVTLTDAELADLGVNELGRVLVMMYHDIDDADTAYGVKLETFKAQMQRLYDEGYRPISQDEMISGQFDIPAGTSPVLMVFDDSYKEHLFFGPDGETPDPDSVVGILEGMEAEDPTWRARAVFSFYWPVPFRETDPDLIDRKLAYLIDNDFDLSNHTYNHDNLKKLSDAEVVENLAKQEMELAERVDPDYRIRSITLTQGIWPENRELAIRGEFEGFSYEHELAYEVGFMPTRSPHHAEYDPMSIMRVHSEVSEFAKWMDWLSEEPGRRLVSDGVPGVVTFPEDWAEVAAPQDGTVAHTYVNPDATVTSGG